MKRNNLINIAISIIFLLLLCFYPIKTIVDNRCSVSFLLSLEVIFICILFVIIILCLFKKLNNQKYIDDVTKGHTFEWFKDKYKKNKGYKTLILLDVSKFKLLNRVYGYDKCNEILQKISKIVEEHMGNNEFSARKSDDKFIMCIDSRDDDRIIELIDNISSDIKKINKNFILNTNYGVYQTHNETIDKAEVKLLIAWGHAKENQCHYYFYREEETKQMIEKKKMLDNFIMALEHDELDIYYQPKCDTQNKKIIGAETLLRWTCKDEMIPASTFIAIAEESGYISIVDNYVMKKVCSQISKLKEDGYDFGEISVNLSRQKLEENTLMSEYEQILEENGLSKEDIELEITEGTVLSDNRKVSLQIKSLLDNGFHILIDDFGTGYSSISMLKEIKVDGIKIDKSFVSDNTETGKNILKYVIILAKKLGLKTIAEGIEEEDQYNYLKQLKCSSAQGFYLHKPMSLDKFKKLLERKAEK